MKKPAFRFQDLRLRNQMFLSYALVGILPFLIFSICIMALTHHQIRNSAMAHFESTMHNCGAVLQQKANKIDLAMNIVASNTGASEAINTEYASGYDKYYQITNFFDTVIDTVLFTNPELEEARFYVNDTLASIRKNFLPLEALEGQDIFLQIRNSVGTKWFYKDGAFWVYMKIYHPANPKEYAVMEVMIPKEELLEPAIFSELSYELLLRGDSVVQSGELPSSNERQTMPVIEGEMSLVGYLDFGGNLLFGGAFWAVMLGILAAFLLLLFTIKTFADGFAGRIYAINRLLSITVKNNFSDTLPEEYHDEIGQLTATINQMIRETKQLIQDVYEGQIKQREYEMKALQAQMNPHFLYNVLSAINWHALTTNNTSISEIVTSLSKFYRTALNQGSNVTTVENELENIRAYLKIQQSIHNGSFDVEYEIDPKALRCQMPNLIIQPIVENAIEHGIDLKTEGRGLLCIQVHRDEDWIQFEISDNGVGIPEEKMEDLLKRDSKSYGLRNVNKRLELFYRDRYRFEFFCEDGTTFLLRLPVS